MKHRLILLILIAAALAAFFLLDLGRFLSLDFLQSQRAQLLDLRDARPMLVTASSSSAAA